MYDMFFIIMQESLHKRLIRRHGVGLVIIDYLQRLHMSGRFERHELLIGEMTKALKTLALESRVAVVLLAQLNRQAEDGREPKLSDLRDSGTLEQDARQILLLSYDGEKQHHILEVAKNNFGKSNKDVGIKREDGKQRFVEVASQFDGLPGEEQL